MSWHKITHRLTGEVQIVRSLGGINQLNWTAQPLGRAPHDYEVFDLTTGKLRDHRKGLKPMPRTFADLEKYVAERVAEELAKKEKPNG